MTLRVRERLRVKERLRKVGHTTMASAQNPHSGVQLALLKEKLIRLNGYPKPYLIMVHTLATKGWFGFKVYLS